ncbi:hypothetical protein Nepgr_012755 [Nepenthes gracilis]|uniref:Receptor-like serine/threonine-protein kinase n=1 Tax=Nepenthes gracilis TaxID=150966 RepID=A0AAD3SHU2_NEPGR|nr:hypothetical protein Nepgr_012755 [Nepenthes gracilis]
MESRKLSVFPFISLMVTTAMTLSAAVDTINLTHPIRDGDTLVSSGGNFVLGFFQPQRSNCRYVGIWYKKVPLPTAVWVANRAVPLVDSTGVLKITKPGILVLVNGSGHLIWSTNSPRSASLQNPVAQLLDLGNLVVREESDENLDNVVWQSFDYPCDTHLPGMKLGWDLVTNFERYLTSWASSDDPSPGNYTYALDRHGYPQMLLMKGSTVQYRSGPWNGITFSGIPGLKPNPIYKFWFVFNKRETYYDYLLLNSSVISRRVLNPYGQMQRLLWNNHTQGWTLYLTAQSDNCDTYALCGAFGSCNIANSPACGCLKGFVPKSPKDWELGDWSDGCLRRTQLDCKIGDGFMKHSNIKLPDTRYSWFNTSMTLGECERACFLNCSCIAYSNLDVRRGGSGCLLWFGDLLDVREYPDFGQDLYVRMASSEIGKLGSGGKKTRIIVTPTILAAVFLSITVTLYFRKKWKKEGKTEFDPKGCSTSGNQKEEADLPLFDFTIIAEATNNFSDDNKVGEGGFGPVYRGVLNGSQIAVKRLSKDSAQGLDEFKNEVLCIARLQHRNLVTFLGCCIQADERMLIYEYMPNKSLDYYIFDKTRSMSLDWPKRFNIINGIARGLLYLHQDSRLLIVHRDLKAGNVLLDHEWNPKISDFGMARIFDGKGCEARTERVVGTYGYMSPEYATDGLFSLKSDVFSFGVLVLEIVSGRRNWRFSHPDHHHNLLGHAWRLYREGESLKLIDSSIDHSNYVDQILRSVHLGLLCVQQSQEDRLSMSAVVVMLSSDNELPPPKQPGFFIERYLEEVNSVSNKVESSSSNEMTITLVTGR